MVYCAELLLFATKRFELRSRKLGDRFGVDAAIALAHCVDHVGAEERPDSVLNHCRGGAAGGRAGALGTRDKLGVNLKGNAAGCHEYMMSPLRSAAPTGSCVAAQLRASVNWPGFNGGLASRSRVVEKCPTGCPVGVR